MSKRKAETQKLLETSTGDIHFSGSANRALTCLRKSGDVKTVGDLTKISKEDIRKFRWMGPKAVDVIEVFLKSKRLSFKKVSKKKSSMTVAELMGDLGESTHYVGP